MSDQNIVEFIPRDQWEKQFAVEANSTKPLSKELNRRRVVAAYMDAFELIGGTQGLVDWAIRSEENLTNFYKLHARLLPSQAVELDDSAQKKFFGHVLPRTGLDQ
jgi:hypothetical protein